MFSKFFINRPIFASVISIIILIAGLVSLKVLPVEEYPEVTPPQVFVTAFYPGASAETISKSVAAPIEQELSGVDDMIYMTSSSSSSGILVITVNFQIGTDPDQATINVNNRVQAALRKIPTEVQATGVSVRKRSSMILKIVSLYSEDDIYDDTYMGNYALNNILDELKRVEGVGDAELFGQLEYAIRVWIKPDSLVKYNLTPLDVVRAIKEQNNQFPAGYINQTPTSSNEAFTYSLTTNGRLTNTIEFENIILRSNPDGSSLKIKDVAEVELGSSQYIVQGTTNGKQSASIGIYLQPGANAVETSDLVDAQMKKISDNFPQKLKYSIPYDTTSFIKISIKEVYQTFFEAMLLVMIIIYFFLQSFRATIIPLLAIPVSIIGTFAGMYALGFSVNLLTLFGLVLAIGIVVDDAIIVIENIERILRDDKEISVKDASIKAMNEITGPIVAIVLILSAVFIPVSFMGGFTGQMYQQFAITIVISVIISGMVALTLTPALCSLFLTRKPPKPFWLVRKFNEFFDKSTIWFSRGVQVIIRYSLISILVVGAIIFSTYKLFNTVPTGLVPMEDKGVLLVGTFLPPASTLSRTKEASKFVSNVALANENIEFVTSISGLDLLTLTPKTSSALTFITLKHWDGRKSHNQSSEYLAKMFSKYLNADPNAFNIAFGPPPISGLSLTGGFEMYVQDRQGDDLTTFSSNVYKIVGAAMQRPELINIRTTLDISVPQYHLDVNIDKAKALNVAITDIYATMQTTFGSNYVNDFNLFGKTYQVKVQAKDIYRQDAENLKSVFVRSQTGNLVPLSSLVTLTRSVGPDMLERFNAFPAAKITGDAAPGYTSGDALRVIEEVANEIIPAGYNLGWTGSSYQEKEMSGTGAQAFIFGIVFVFLILAAQYERWLMPFAVVTAIPFAVFGSITAVWMRGLMNDIYFQVGLLVLIGLSAKNAVLIVEFAMHLREQGKSIIEATVEAAKLRFRPIIMTSLAFTLGVLPLAISTGAGAASRNSIGTGVIGGMIAASTLSILFVPLFFNYISKFSDRFGKKKVEVSKEDKEILDEKK